MNTLAKSSQKIHGLQALVLGDRNSFAFLKEHESSLDNKNESKVVKFLLNLNKIGYSFSNIDILFNLNKKDFKRFKTEFKELISSSTKDGMVFRKTFGESEELTEYTTEEWMAILAQYSITYGWGYEYHERFGSDSQEILGNYVGSMSSEISDITSEEVKVVEIIEAEGLTSLIKNIVESPAVLRAQQIKTLESCPTGILVESCRGSNIQIKETLIKVMSLLSGTSLDFPLLKTSTDVLRFVVSVHAHTPLEGQLNKSDLKAVRLRIPSSARKLLLRNLEAIAIRRNNTKNIISVDSSIRNSDIGAKYLAEDMFQFDMFWKRLDKYLRYESSKKTREKFPNYTKAIDIIYSGDRSFTFNSRFSVAKSDLNYDLAIRIASERPGFLMRNLLEFLRMTDGVRLPVKQGSSSTSNPFQNALDKKEPNRTSVKTDASGFLLSDDFLKILNKNLNPKLAWQLLENLKDESIFIPVNSRIVQGVTVNYSTPFPGLNKKLTEKVRKQISKSLKKTLSERNKDLGKIFVTEDSKKQRIQYSGRSSTEISFSGEFLSPGSELLLSDIVEKKGLDNVVLRLGVMWRGLRSGQSVDVDHNVKIDHKHNLYYSRPTFLSSSGTVIGASSGDITSCGGPEGKFSTELIDIDLAKAYDFGVSEFYNSLIVYSGVTTLGELESYLFFSLIDKSSRKMGTNVNVDLSKADYAIRIDPDNIDATGSYIGVNFDLKKDKVSVLCSPIKNSSGGFSNVATNEKSFREALNNFDKHLSLNYVIKRAFGEDQLAKDISEASIVISRKSREDLELADDIIVIHPGREMEEINKLIF